MPVSQSERTQRYKHRMEEEKKEKKSAGSEKGIVIYDPSVDACREVPISLAKKFVESAKEVENQLKGIEKA